MEIARRWIAQGAGFLHLVDLDGARDGVPRNRETIRRILKISSVPVQIGGGIRTLADIEDYLTSGASRVILGTAAYADPGFLAAACRRWPGQIAVDIAARGGKAAISGWTEETAMAAVELARKCESLGASWVIYTDILRDGAQQGINLESTRLVARALHIPVIASGGVSTIEDIVSLLPLEAEGVRGAIVGRALYAGTLDLREAISLAERNKAEMLTKRIIPCLDVKDGRVVKGTNFIHLRDAGDPVENAREYDGQGADELTFLDITASSERRKIILDVVRRTAEEVFMPLTVGGGIRSLEDIRELLQAGADKVSINTAAVNNPELVREASEKFGTQCIVVAIDAKRKSASAEFWKEAERALRGEGRPSLTPVGLQIFPGKFLSTEEERPPAWTPSGGLRKWRTTAPGKFFLPAWIGMEPKSVMIFL